MPHKFKTGQLVEYHPPRGLYAPRGHHLITAQLPERNGEFEYRIRHTDEMHERIANERELSMNWLAGFRTWRDFMLNALRLKRRPNVSRSVISV
jgi:hypothetical protein